MKHLKIKNTELYGYNPNGRAEREAEAIKKARAYL